MSQLFGIKRFIPPWEWRHGNSGFVGGTASRVLLANPSKYWTISAEIGAGKRFGALHSGETWLAFTYRWHAFPWNNLLRTSIGVSTGLNYAFENEYWERRRLENGGRGSQLLHYLAPEISFQHPDHEQFEVFVRVHHRSGGHMFFGPIKLFHGGWGGAQYTVAGVRYRF